MREKQQKRLGRRVTVAATVAGLAAGRIPKPIPAGSLCR